MSVSVEIAESRIDLDRTTEHTGEAVSGRSTLEADQPPAGVGAPPGLSRPED
jgi:hypothetical protein